MGKALSFPFRFNKKGGLSNVVTNTTDHIDEHLTQILTTRKGERVMLANYGVNLEAYLFENIDEGLESILKEEIKEAIMTYSDKVTIDTDDIRVTSEGNSLFLHLVYVIRDSGEQKDFSLKLR